MGLYQRAAKLGDLSSFQILCSQVTNKSHLFSRVIPLLDSVPNLGILKIVTKDYKPSPKEWMACTKQVLRNTILSPRTVGKAAQKLLEKVDPSSFPTDYLSCQLKILALQEKYMALANLSLRSQLNLLQTAHVLLWLDPVLAKEEWSQCRSKLWNDLVSEIKRKKPDSQTALVVQEAIDTFAYHFLTTENVQEFMTIQQRVQSWHSTKQKYHLIYVMNDYLNTVSTPNASKQDWIKSWKSKAFSTVFKHSQKLSSFFVSMGVQSLEWGLGNFKEKDFHELWNFLKTHHGFIPTLREYHALLNYYCTYPSESDQESHRVQNWLLKMRLAGVFPTAETFLILFKGCQFVKEQDRIQKLKEFETEMFEKGIGHSDHSLGEWFAIAIQSHAWDVVRDRLDQIRFSEFPVGLLFYHMLLSTCTLSKEASEFALKELYFIMKRDRNVSLNQRSLELLLECCQTCHDKESAERIRLDFENTKE